MKLIVGLGNPGQEYKNTRHNVGFMVVEELARELRVIRQKYVHSGVVAWTRFHGETLLIAKPLTFMNLSGKAVQQMVKANHITLSELMVVVDDLDLELGVIRLRLEEAAVDIRDYNPLSIAWEPRIFHDCGSVSAGRPVRTLLTGF